MTNRSERAVSSMTTREFYTKFPDEISAIDHFLNIRYPDGLTCPHCRGKVKISRYRARPKFFQCNSCNNSFSPFKNTIFEHTHIDMRRWFETIKHFTNGRKGISACQLQREIGVTYVTALRMLRQLRKAMANEKTEWMFEGAVEVDETYVGGKPRKTNAVLDDNNNVIRHPKVINKRGRGTKKIAVNGAKERGTNRVIAKVAKPDKYGRKVTGRQCVGFVKKIVKPGSVVITDEYSGYNGLHCWPV